MTWLFVAGGTWVAGAIAAWSLRSFGRIAIGVALGTIGLGALFGALGLGAALCPPVEEFHRAWDSPLGDLALRLDPLSGVFLAPIFVIGTLAAVFGAAYLRSDSSARVVAAHLAVFELLLASMALVVVAANTVLLLVGWELMTILSWSLLATDHDSREVRSAGLGYLIAGHVSGAGLLFLFALLAGATGTWLLPSQPYGTLPAALPPVAVLLVLALVGFGTKAAIAPLHVWLPDAHAAAPSHVSALLSAVLITLGFYGLVRVAWVFGPLPATAGTLLMALGALGACGGILMALSQRDVKRILAYSTIENAGLIALAIGSAWLATAVGRPAVAALAWGAALLHIWNHAVAKSLLFLSAGTIAHAVKSRDLERWGGLLRRMPVLGTAMLVGGASVIGLPGTHGFASEWLLFMALFRGSHDLPGALRVAMVLGVVALAFSAGTALAAFVRVIGVGLLGHARSPEAADAHAPSGAAWLVPTIVLAAMCFGLAFAIQPLLAWLTPAVRQLAPQGDLAELAPSTAALSWIPTALIFGAGAVALYRWWLGRTRSVRHGPAWDCGFARPASSMEYTASSLAQPITGVLQPALRTSVEWSPPRGLWPARLSWVAHTPERALAEFYRPTFVRIAALLGFASRLQEGRVMVYLRYVGLALLVLLVWLFFPVAALR